MSKDANKKNISTRGVNENSLKNLKMFSGEYQPSKDSVRKRVATRKKNKEIKDLHNSMVRILFEELYKLGAFDLAPKVAVEKAKDGDLKDLLELIKICKPNDNNKIEINAMQNVQKVFVTKKDEKNVNKHIDSIIG